MPRFGGVQGRSGLVLTVKTGGFRTIWNSSPEPREPPEPRKWWQDPRLGPPIPHAPGARMTAVTQTPSNRSSVVISHLAERVHTWRGISPIWRRESILGEAYHPFGSTQKSKVMTESTLYKSYREILFQKVALGCLLHFVQNGSSNNIRQKCVCTTISNI